MSNPMTRRALASLVLLAGCSPAWQQSTMEHPTVMLSYEERAAGWRPLFDGVSLAGWRIYHDGAPNGWRVVDGLIERGTGGGDLVTTETFANFDLALEWKLPPGGNSGVIYRVNDAGAHTYETGPEMQILDDERHPDGRNPSRSAGAVYDLYPAPRGVVKPVGEWNQARLLVNGNHVEHWLNGTLMGQYELGSPDWEQRVAASKFKDWKGYGRSPRGRIALQDHGNQVWFRNIRIRELP
jgi:hypothetical protein